MDIKHIAAIQNQKKELQLPRLNLLHTERIYMKQENCEQCNKSFPKIIMLKIIKHANNKDLEGKKICQQCYEKTYYN